MTPVSIDVAMRDGDQPRVGNNIVLTMVPTPGHTNGSTSWSWVSCEGTQCATFAYVDSLTAVSADTYRFIDHPDRVAPFYTTFDRVAAMPCDILVTPHPSVSNLFDRLGGVAPLTDAHACRDLAQTMRTRLDNRLAKERSQ